MATVTLRGNEIETCGELPAIGSKAPDFQLVSSALQDVTLADYAGKQKVLNIVPSLDTPTCQTSTRVFNEKAAGLENTVVLVVSADLPFAQKRFCEAEGIENVQALSMMRNRNFAKDYGVMFTSGPLTGVTTRAVVVIDGDDNVTYTQLVSEVSEEPDYDAALAALN